MYRSLNRLAFALPLASLLLACGANPQVPPSVPPREPDLSPPPAGKIAVVVPRAVTPVGGALRTAVLWSTYEIGDIFEPGTIKALAVSADTAVPADLPSRVLLDVEEITKGPLSTPQMPFLVFGTPVLYEDTNKNGRLDLAKAADTQATDRLVGTADHLVFIVAVGGDKTGGPELHLARTPASGALPPLCDEPMPGTEELPLTTVIQIPVNAGARFELALCEEQTIDMNTACDLSGGEGAPTVTCNADGSGFVASSIQDQGTPCAHWVHCSSRECPAPDELPAYCPAAIIPQ